MPRTAVAAVLLAFAVALPALAAASAPPNREQVRLTRADQAAARAAVLRRADLGSSGWSGGFAKPDLSATLSCRGYTPKQSDLVLTGAAEADFHQIGLQVQSVAQVLKTRSMVARDWRRTVADPRALTCVRRMVTKGLTAGERLVSFHKLAFPRLARYAAAYRAILRVQAQGRSVPVLVDIVLVGRSRTELTLSLGAPAGTAGIVSAAELRLVRAMLARVRA